MRSHVCFVACPSLSLVSLYLSLLPEHRPTRIHFTLSFVAVCLRHLIFCPSVYWFVSLSACLFLSIWACGNVFFQMRMIAFKCIMRRFKCSVTSEPKFVSRVQVARVVWCAFSGIPPLFFQQTCVFFQPKKIYKAHNQNTDSQNRILSCVLVWHPSESQTLRTRFSGITPTFPWSRSVLLRM